MGEGTYTFEKDTAQLPHHNWISTTALATAAPLRLHAAFFPHTTSCNCAQARCSVVKLQTGHVAAPIIRLAGPTSCTERGGWSTRTGSVVATAVLGEKQKRNDGGLCEENAKHHTTHSTRHRFFPLVARPPPSLFSASAARLVVQAPPCSGQNCPCSTSRPLLWHSLPISHSPHLNNTAVAQTGRDSPRTPSTPHTMSNPISFGRARHAGMAAPPAPLERQVSHSLNRSISIRYAPFFCVVPGVS